LKYLSRENENLKDTVKLDLHLYIANTHIINPSVFCFVVVDADDKMDHAGRLRSKIDTFYLFQKFQTLTKVWNSFKRK